MIFLHYKINTYAYCGRLDCGRKDFDVSVNSKSIRQRSKQTNLKSIKTFQKLEIKDKNTKF